MGQYYYPTILHKDRFVSLAWKRTKRIPKLLKEIERVGLKEWEKWISSGLDDSYLLLLGYAAQKGSTIDGVPVLKEPFALLGEYHEEAGKTREWKEVPLYTKITQRHMWVAAYSDYVLFVPVTKSNLLSILLTTSNGTGLGDVFSKYEPPAIPEAFTTTLPKNINQMLEMFNKRRGVVISDDDPIMERENDKDALATLASQYRAAVMSGFRHLVSFLLEYDFKFYI